ncbi:MAG: SPOR domain-containing protein [Deltaproteobacteria bacterium]|nr:SPOR domain-containing protein [Deltaproteobacteria bacterium]
MAREVDTAVRDLERIRERDDEGTVRQRTMILLAVAVGTVAAIFALGVIAGRGRNATASPASVDPLTRLDRLAARSGEARETRGTRVSSTDMTFPSTLTDTRAEVEAAMAAAAAEAEHPDHIDGVAPPAVPSTPGAEGTAEVPEPPPVAGPSDSPAALLAPPPGAAGMLGEARAPAAADQLAARAILANDPLVARALPRAIRGFGPPAPPGRDGVFTLQVSSYNHEQDARRFMEALRTRGHRAFVVRAQIQGRGTVWRVRIGPFETLAAAERYRREFETAEHMSTFLVRRELQEENLD